MKFLVMLSKIGAWASGWTSAVLCFSAASGFYLAAEHKKAVAWLALGVAEIIAIVW
jgi:hypothetical protein